MWKPVGGPRAAVGAVTCLLVAGMLVLTGGQQKELPAAGGADVFSTYFRRLARERRAVSGPGRRSDPPRPVEQLTQADLFVAVKTTGRYHRQDLKLLLDTWVSRNAPQKHVLRTDKKPEDTVEHTVTSQAETKENKPATNKTCIGKAQSNLQSLQSPSKPRSPLSDSVIQEGNDSDATNPDMSRLKKGTPTKIKEGCEPSEPKPELASHSHGTRERATDQLEQKELDKQPDVKSATGGKLPSKPRHRSGRKHRAKKTENKAPQSRKVTDYFPIRRSNRKTKTELKSEEHKHIDDLINNGIEEGMEVKCMEGKGRGVFAVKGFKKGEYVVEYHGDLLDLAQAKIREAQYAKDPQTGCYMYYFQYQSKNYCVDATKETGRLGRLINHSKSGNCQTRLHPIDGTPHLILVASKDIEVEEELLYDYGDRSKDSVSAHPWLKY